MSLLRRVDIMDCPFFHPPSVSFAETSIFTPKSLAFPRFFEESCEDIFLGLDLLNPEPHPFDLLDTVTDLVRIERTPFQCSYKRVQSRAGGDPYLLSLADRVSALEHKLDLLVSARGGGGNRKYKWSAEIEGRDGDRKYSWVAEIKSGKEKKREKREGRSYKWVAEIKEKGEGGERTYMWTAKTGSEEKKEKKKDKEKDKEKKEKKKKEKGESSTRLVEIEEPIDHRAIILRQVR